MAIKIVNAYGIAIFGMLCSAIGVLVYWLFQGMIAFAAAVIIITVLYAVFMGIFVSISIEDFRAGRSIWLTELVSLVVLYNIGFVIPLWMTDFFGATFHVELRLAVGFLLAIAVGVAILVSDERKAQAKQAAAQPPAVAETDIGDQCFDCNQFDWCPSMRKADVAKFEKIASDYRCDFVSEEW